MPGKSTSGNRSERRGHRPRSFWRGSVGPSARLALRVMALQDAVAARIEQGEAEERLIARLILEERARRLDDAEILPGLTLVQAERMTAAEYDDWFEANRDRIGV